jgi:hypothetical protein
MFVFEGEAHTAFEIVLVPAVTPKQEQALE